MSEVHVKFCDDLAIIMVDNPPVNALSPSVRAGLVDAMEEADGSRDVKAIVLTCVGRTFFAGADIREFSKPPQAPHLSVVVERIEENEKPVVAAIHGTALGGGFEIALGCHYRVAPPDAQIGFPEVTLGLLPGATGTQRLPRLVGVERALNIMISGKPMDAVCLLYTSPSPRD